MAASPELKATHPLGKSPIVEVDGQVLAEPGAIVEMLAKGSALVPPEGSGAHASYFHILHFAEGSAMPPLLLKLYFDRLVENVPPPVRARIQAQIDDVLDYLEGTVRTSGWFAGDAFSAADVQISVPVKAAVQRGGLDAGRPTLWDFLARIHARPAYRRALERGGSYAFAS